MYVCLMFHLKEICLLNEFSWLKLSTLFCMTFLGYLTAAATKKTPIPALGCLHIEPHRVMPMPSLKYRTPPLIVSAGSTTLSCPLSLPRPAKEKPGRGRAGRTASGRRRGARAASGRLCCPGRAAVWDRAKGYAWRMKLRGSGRSLNACR